MSTRRIFLLILQIIILGISIQAVDIPFKSTRVSERVLLLGANNNARAVILNTKRGLVFIDCFWSPAVVQEAKKIIEKEFGKKKSNSSYSDKCIYITIRWY